MAGAKKGATILVKLASAAGTGFFYVKKKNPRTLPRKLEVREGGARGATAPADRERAPHALGVRGRRSAAQSHRASGVASIPPDHHQSGDAEGKPRPCGRGGANEDAGAGALSSTWPPSSLLSPLSFLISLSISTQFVKYDPVVRRHVLFTETKLK
jgi:ribosomal protein L33